MRFRCRVTAVQLKDLSPPPRRGRLGGGRSPKPWMGVSAQAYPRAEPQTREGVIAQNKIRAQPIQCMIKLSLSTSSLASRSSPLARRSPLADPPTHALQRAAVRRRHGINCRARRQSRLRSWGDPGSAPHHSVSLHAAVHPGWRVRRGPWLASRANLLRQNGSILTKTWSIPCPECASRLGTEQHQCHAPRPEKSTGQQWTPPPPPSMTSWMIPAMTPGLASWHGQDARHIIKVSDLPLPGCDRNRHCRLTIVDCPLSIAD